MNKNFTKIPKFLNFQSGNVYDIVNGVEFLNDPKLAMGYTEDPPCIVFVLIGIMNYCGYTNIDDIAYADSKENVRIYKTIFL